MFLDIFTNPYTRTLMNTVDLRGQEGARKEPAQTCRCTTHMHAHTHTRTHTHTHSYACAFQIEEGKRALEESQRKLADAQRTASGWESKRSVMDEKLKELQVDCCA